uniref:Uncharacterized protein n=1 Tax=Oryza glumipatula TaxID=40148 RepID=A0A0D9ZXB2_9ORYZ
MTTKKKPPSSSPSTSAVAKLLLRWRGRSKAAKDESIEFFSELRSGQPDRRGAASDHAGGGGAPDGRGKAKSAAPAAAGGDAGGGGKLLSTGTEKHDYDWLLTPPASPLWSPATSAAAGHHVSAAPPPSRLERASSAPYAKGNSRLPLTRRENGPPASRLSRSSSATSQLSTVAHAPGTVFSGRRTLSSASVSSINTASSTSVGSTPRGSSASTSPRTPATARGAPAGAARPRHRDRTQALHVFGAAAAAGQPSASSLVSRSRPSLTAPSSGALQRATPGAAGTSSPRSTAPACQQPAATRRGANSVARSGSTPRAASPSPRARDVSIAAGASRVAPPAMSSSKPRQAPASGKQSNGNGMAAASTAAQRWRSAGRNARREEAVTHESSRNSDSRRKIDVANTSAAARRTADLSSPRGASGGSPTSGGGGRNKSTDTDAKRSLWQGAAARHLMAAARRDATPITRRSGGLSSVASRSRLGITPAASSGDISATPTGRRSTQAKGRPAADAAAAAAAASPRVAAGDAFPSSRYDAMLLREDPRNLTWLHGCDDDEEIDGGDLVEASLESFDVPAGLSSTGLHGGRTLNFGANL